MFTSRAEYRLLLRSDNADLRLFEIGHRLGLLPPGALERLERKRSDLRGALAYLETHAHAGKDLLRILRQPEHGYRSVEALDDGLRALSLDDAAAQAVEIEAKYASYIERQNAQVEKWKRMKAAAFRRTSTTPGSAGSARSRARSS
jgi:tRNA uridine 5-carboxymethylaminomethyl modification enzyme